VKNSPECRKNSATENQLENINYSNYSLEELYDVERNIDAQTYPAKYRQILEQISIKKTEAMSIDSTADNIDDYSSYRQDPVAKHTSWTPLISGGSNFATHKLDKTSRSQIRIKPSLALYLFTLVFSGISVVAFLNMDNALVDNGEWPTNLDQYMQTFIPMVFIGASFYLLYKLTEKIVFDKRAGIYWKGHKRPSRLAKIASVKNSIRLDQIHAIQLITELVDGNDSNYYSFELNLVLKNGDRMGVVDHGNQDRIRDNAVTLSKFLNVPIWEREERSERNSFFSIFGMKI